MMKYVRASVVHTTGKTICPQDNGKFTADNPGLNAKGIVKELIEGGHAKVAFGNVVIAVDLKDYITEVPWRVLVNGVVCDVIDCDEVSLTVMKEGAEVKTPFTSETLL